ncbi:hypothetical protein FH972_011897 [Carpinus fangiana]|uniref:Uncharacterized protein n=1 Tax=Carpinus fangiana TaxID=176857 RepID=A0A5N6R5K3_9ROSI|nr:hypothetical protein FH972_011897 [Carpinus fangiana]
MNSLFSSFDFLFAEFLGQAVRASIFPSSAATAANSRSVKSQLDDGVVKKATDNVSKKQQPRKTLRLAPELDGLNCFETIVSSS